MNIRIELYSPQQKRAWDEFVRQSKNGTFLFMRDYMDYHHDRFQDHSLLVWDDQILLAILPANRSNNTVVSHGGLTYGGFVTPKEMRLTVMAAFFPLVLQDLVGRGVKTFIYKAIPHIYHLGPAEDDRYCLFRNGATIYRTDVLTVIDYEAQIKYQERRARSIRRAKKLELLVKQTDDYATFWDILAGNLHSRYGLNPVHSLDEIRLLASRFPDQIRLYAAYEDQTMSAGALLYLTENVCHVQYNAASEHGKELRAQDFLMDYLVEGHRGSHRYFDFGVSTEHEGQDLNNGLIEYKEGFGARTIVHDFYTLDLSP